MEGLRRLPWEFTAVRVLTESRTRQGDRLRAGSSQGEVPTAEPSGRIGHAQLDFGIHAMISTIPELRIPAPQPTEMRQPRDPPPRRRRRRGDRARRRHRRRGPASAKPVLGQRLGVVRDPFWHGWSSVTTSRSVARRDAATLHEMSKSSGALSALSFHRMPLPPPIRAARYTPGESPPVYPNPVPSCCSLP
jgi:hypothetical protein